MAFTRQAMQAFTNTLTVQTAGMNAAAAKKAMVQVAERERSRVVREQVRRSGAAPDLTQTVDGRQGAPFTAVRPDGYILLEWSYFDEVALEAVTLLREGGPARSGRWRDGIAVFADDVEVPATAIPQGAKVIQVVATVPYSRRLEVGKERDNSPFSEKAFGLVANVAIELRRQYRNVAKIDFTYVEMAADKAARGAAKARGNRAPRSSSPRYPAILIRGL